MHAQSLSHVQLFVTAWNVTHQSPLSMGFSRQEYWSGQTFSSSGDPPDPRIEPRSPTLQADSLWSEPLGKLKKTGVGTLSVLQWVFLTQGLNQCLLHCRQILYQLSYQWCLCTPLINIPQLSRFSDSFRTDCPTVSMRKREETQRGKERKKGIKR